MPRHCQADDVRTLAPRCSQLTFASQVHSGEIDSCHLSHDHHHRHRHLSHDHHHRKGSVDNKAQASGKGEWEWEV